ncbi:hypothetical protein NJH83_21810 [Pseudomonas chlororaphis]|uniref:hypothetical protein n=1 Tax=Pseudomonas chlororaphis TaxID=587753 RepID=UPI00209B4914|nr:hypothetical protein [Pseudomonas chlororaphis]MCO7612870.1 hypothetical protein [Pseudomonas chlororaphis]
MTTSNIKQFDEFTGLILGALYECFPVPRNLTVTKLIPDASYFNEAYGAEIPNAKGEFLFACIDWLAESGYLRFSDKTYNVGYLDAVLTAKGLEVLKAVPDSLSTGPTLGDQLVDATKSGAKSLLGDIAGQALSIGVKFATNHFGLPG